MNQHSSHLTDRQIEQYVAESYGPDPAPRNEEIGDHLAECDSCRGRWLEAERIQLGILDHHRPKTPRPGCPDEGLLQECAAGICSPETAAAVRAHAAQCEFCAPLLKEYLEDFSGQFTGEAQDFLNGLPASKPSWRQGFVRKHIVHRPGFLSRLKALLFRFVPRPFWGKAALAGVLASALLVSVVVGPTVADKYKLHQAEQLAAAAFVERRPTEMRFTWAPYSKFTQKRSNSPGQIDFFHNKYLSAANNAVVTKEDSRDPKWIRVRGRVAMLLGDNEASDLLAKARDGGLDDPGTEIDLAAAYFQRDTSTGQNLPDLGNTINLLIHVLKNPKIVSEEKATALFDLAIAHEKILMWNQAVDEWREYLKVDQDVAGPWHKEAEEHLDHALKQMHPPRQLGWREPWFFLQYVFAPEVLDSIEEYQEIALRRWILEAIANPNGPAFEALHTLADLLDDQQHADPWMKDFLRAVQPGDQAALQALAAAIENNKRGLHTQARAQAQIASAIFAQRRNYPGNLRARFEAVYANQRLLEGQRCRNDAQQLGKQLQNTHYYWLQAQIALEQATCLHFEGVGKSDESENQLQLARQAAENSHFPILRLRVLAFTAGIKDSGLKESGKCWNQIAGPVGEGLGQYWASSNPPGRLYEFYSLIKQCFRQRRLWHASEALERRMIDILEKEIDPEDENVVLEVTAHRALAQILKAQQEEGAAEAEARQAITLLSKIPDEAALRKYELLIKLELAELLLEREDTEGSLAIVNEAAELVASTPDELVRLNFYRIRGDAQRKRHQASEAERDYKTALEIAERALGHLAGEDKRRQWTTDTGEIYRGLVGVFLEEKNDQEALQLWEWYQARSFAQETNAAEEVSGNSWPRIEQTVLREPLPNGSSTRLVYATTRDSLYIWIIGRAGIRTVLLPANREDLERRIRQYSQKCSNPISNTAALEEESQQLFALLLQPAIANLRDSDTVVVELDDAMNGLALGTLKSPEGWYFGQKYLVVQSPGLIMENNLRPPVQTAYQSGLLLDSGELASTEHDDIVRFFPTIQTLNGSNATSAQLPALLADRDMFIFIGHGKAGTLMMNDSVPLTSSNFPPESLKDLRLAVLAACSTGVAEYGPLDTNNLVHAFLAGGTSSVVASQWDVDSQATKELMKVFFSHRIRGESVAHSLYEARKYVFRSHNHPYYWGGFNVIGRAN